MKILLVMLLINNINVGYIEVEEYPTIETCVYAKHRAYMDTDNRYKEYYCLYKIDEDKDA